MRYFLPMHDLKSSSTSLCFVFGLIESWPSVCKGGYEIEYLASQPLSTRKKLRMVLSGPAYSIYHKEYSVNIFYLIKDFLSK